MSRIIVQFCVILVLYSAFASADTCGGLNCHDERCCIDQANGPQCYTASYECVNGNKLCWKGDGICGVYPAQYCYNTALYTCDANGNLVQTGSATTGGSTTTAFTTTGPATTSPSTCTREASQIGFTTVPPTSQSYYAGNGREPRNLTISNTSLVLIDCKAGRASSWWYPTPVCVSSNIYVKYVWSYDKNCGSPDIGDGLSFTLQPNGPNAIGDAGGALGTAGIPDAAAIDFWIYQWQTTLIRTKNTDSTGAATVTSSALYSAPKNTDLTVIIQRSSNSTYSVSVNGIVQATIADSVFDIVSDGDPIYAGITAGTGASFTSFYLNEFTYRDLSAIDTTTTGGI